jgi:2-dehydro-3-deoxyphosphogluconate aldolase/(4S)-4-hydroxy-2-oxoglutarate aldolase
MTFIETTLQHLFQKQIPVIRASSLSDALWTAEQLLQAHFTCVEFTFTTPQISAFFNAPRPRWIPPHVLIGLGTLTTPLQVETVLEMPFPPDFVASPGLLEEAPLKQAIKGFKERDILYMAGVATPSELMHALALGVEAVKWFPAEPLGGSSTLKTMKAPFPEAKLMPFGGVHPSQVNRYLEAGAWAVGMGTCLMPRPDQLKARDSSGFQRDLKALLG